MSLVAAARAHSECGLARKGELDAPQHHHDPDTRQHAPKTGTEHSPPRDASDHRENPNPPAPCCSREKITEQWCAWHHPRIQRHDQCRARTNTGRQCRERALTVPDASPCFEAQHCWYHLSVDQRTRLVGVLQGRNNSRSTTTAPKPKTAHSAKPRPHHDIRLAVSPAFVRVGSCVTVAMISPLTPAGAVAEVVLRIVTPSTATAPARATPQAWFCATCECWHAFESRSDGPDGDDTVAIPSAEASYFSLRPSTSDEEQTVGSPDCTNDDIGSDVDPADFDEDRPERNLLNLREATLSFPGGNPYPAMKACQSWYVYSADERPSHVHKLTWNSRSKATRAEHIRWLRRIQSAPPELRALPLDKGVIELILRLGQERRWRMSTISSKLSAAKSALAALPIYSNVTHEIDIDTVYYRQTVEAVQKAARVEAIHPQRSRAVTRDEFNNVISSLHGDSAGATPALLGEASWWLAGRVGDVRRLSPTNLAVKPTEHAEWHEVTALFTQGKGAHFWGPFTVKTRMPTRHAKLLQEHARNRAAHGKDTLFDTSDQTALSRAIAQLNDASLRSIRRGALCWFAENGVGEANLQLLSGHRRTDTLLRYLGFGRLSADASAAAASRTAKIDPIMGAGPTKMGHRSGFGGTKGRRSAPPPQLFARQPPSRQDLGLPSSHEPKSNSDPPCEHDDPASWPLHVKNVTTISLRRVRELASSLDLRKAARQAARLLSDPTCCAPEWPPMTLQQCPKTSFTADQWTTMFAGGKCVPVRELPDRSIVFLHGTKKPNASKPTHIASACRGFAVQQPQKRRWRPVFEPLQNHAQKRDLLPPLGYPSRSERRANLATCKFRAEFDFAAWYDQLRMSDDMLNMHVCRTKEPVEVKWPDGSTEWVNAFALTRAPMGASWSAHVAQTVTWILLEPIITKRDVIVHTMIDNIALGSNDKAEFAHAVRLFLARAAHVGAQLNDHPFRESMTDDEIVAAATAPEWTFLGETYHGNKVANSKKNVDKMRESFVNLQEHHRLDRPVSRRALAAAISLCIWMSNTLNIPIHSQFDLVRAWPNPDETTPAKWDEAIPISTTTMNLVAKAVGPLLANVPVVPASRAQGDCSRHDSFDATIIVDASAAGVGFLWANHKTGTVEVVKRGWASPITKSAWAEPLGAKAAVQFVREQLQLPHARLAIVSDHEALASGQRRPNSGHGGFSRAFYANSFFATLYGTTPAETRVDHQIFYVPGSRNPADVPSRDVYIGDTTWHRRTVVDAQLPPLDTFHHPYAPSKPRLVWWNT